jgi:hypothetical protein
MLGRFKFLNRLLTQMLGRFSLLTGSLTMMLGRFTFRMGLLVTLAVIGIAYSMFFQKPVAVLAGCFQMPVVFLAGCTLVVGARYLLPLFGRSLTKHHYRFFKEFLGPVFPSGNYTTCGWITYLGYELALHFLALHFTNNMLELKVTECKLVTSMFCFVPVFLRRCAHHIVLSTAPNAKGASIRYLTNWDST